MLRTIPRPSPHAAPLGFLQRLGWRAGLVLLWLLALPALWVSLTAAPAIRVEVGEWGDHTRVTGVNGIEQAAQEDYRWTTGRAELLVPNLSGRYELLRLRAHGWRPEGMASPAVGLDVSGREWGGFVTTPQLRVYSVLLPYEPATPTTRVGFASDSYSPEGDPRQIGFALDWVELRALSRADGPSAWQLGGQALLLGLALLLLAALALPAWPTLLSAAVTVVAVVATNLWQPLWVSQGLPAWLALAALLLAATWLVAPRFYGVVAAERPLTTDHRPLTTDHRPPPAAERPLAISNASGAGRSTGGWMTPGQARVAWALIVAAFALRLAGAAHPLFDARDMPVHTRWLATVSEGSLYLYSTPAELQNRQTFNPPAAYVLLLPARLLLGEDRLAVQVGTALLDALGCVLLLPLARELRMGPRAGLLGLALYLALPINMTMMWWGFAANAVAQSLWLLLLWLLLRLTSEPTPRALVLTTVAGALCLLTHVGALVLLVAAVGLLVGLGWRALPGRSWRALVGAALLALAFTAPVYFAAAAAPLAGEERGPGSLDLAASLARGIAERDVRVGLVLRALQIGWLPAVAGLAPLGLVLLALAARRHPLQRLLIGASLLICAVFFLTYVYLGLLTRYIYFVTPLVCLAAGAVLARLWPRPGGRWVVGTLVLFVCWSGAALWLGGVLLRIRPSLVPLTQ
jgi:toxin CptA